jgi:DNA-binding GntR family transcriptional regulator
LEPTEAITPRSLQEEVYQRLRRLIFNRDPEPKILKVRQLADQFGISPMPVREALRRLEADGLVTFTRNRGIVISRLSSREVEDIFEIRLRLEPFASRRAAGRITAESLEELEELCGRLDDFLDGDEWRANNAKFHKIIVTACGIPRLIPIIDNLWLAVEPYRRYYIRNHRLLAMAQEQHREIVRALREQDGRKVERILESHLTNTLEAILDGMGRSESVVKEEPWRN